VKWGLTIEEAVKFHGHLGPWLAIGYRAGAIARDKLNPKVFHELHCTVRVPNKVPYSCSIDGVQASASCTLGKGNIAIEDSSDFEFVFVSATTKESMKLKLKRSVIDRLLSFKSIEEAVKYIVGLEDWEIFESS
jgi:formylmethanofuran dehydrogenase subunit E